MDKFVIRSKKRTLESTSVDVEETRATKVPQNSDHTDKAEAAGKVTTYQIIRVRASGLSYLAQQTR